MRFLKGRLLVSVGINSLAIIFSYGVASNYTFQLRVFISCVVTSVMDEIVFSHWSSLCTNINKNTTVKNDHIYLGVLSYKEAGGGGINKGDFFWIGGGGLVGGWRKEV